MKAHTNEFKERISRLGRELDSKITYTLNNEEIELGSEELNSVTPHYEGAILKSVMKQLDIDSNVEIPVGTEINYIFGVKVRDNVVLNYRENYDYVNFGNYIVYSVERQEDTLSYKITCYDKMLYAMKDYETPKVSDVLITYPITVKDYLQAICSHLGLTYTYVAFANDDKQIPEELYLDEGQNTLGYTFRDVLDEIAEVSGGTICINEDDELEVRYINKSAVLPSEYTQVEYIESNGNGTYINTQYKPTSNTTFELDCQFISSTNTNSAIPIFGERISSGSTKKCAVWINKNTNRVALNFGSYDSNYQLNTNMSVRHVISNKNAKLYYDWVLIASGTEQTFTEASYPLYLFALNEGTLTYRNQITRVYSLKIYEEGTLVRNYVPCLRNSDSVAGMYDVINNTFYTTPGNGTFNYGQIITNEIIDEEMLKDINVNFGEKFGPVNTIVLSRGGAGDKISLSRPADLPDGTKIPIQITDNQIMNGNDRDEYMADILDKLYGLEYYINDFTSTGICYLDLCDRYGVKIGDTTYSCIMFNNEVNITQGLVEITYTNMPEESEQEYKYMSSNDRGITQANIIAKKNEGVITEYTQKLDEAINRLNAVETTQTDTSRTIDVLSKNIDSNGNITAVKVKEGFTFDENGLQIYTDDNSFKTQIDETGTYYYDGTTKVAEYTKDGSKQKDLRLFGVYYYGMKTITDTPMFVAQLYTDEDGEECFGHFYNRGGN